MTSEVIWAPHKGPQTAFLQSPVREVLYGGAAAGGKTDALVAAPLRWADHPGLKGIILRKSRQTETQEILDRQAELYPRVAPGTYWNGRKHRWDFPAGGYVQVAGMHTDADLDKIKSFQYNFIGFDELTAFPESYYLFMFSRNRSKYPDLPLQIRSGTNPDGEYHAWVYDRFVKDRVPYQAYEHPVVLPDGEIVYTTRQFIPASVYDNPAIGRIEDYIAGMAQMGEELTAAQLKGEWNVFGGQMFPSSPREVPAVLKGEDYYVIRCMDYGWANETVIYWLVAYRDKPLLEIVRELTLKRANIATIAKEIKHAELMLFSKDGIKHARHPALSEIDPSAAKTEGTSEQSISSMLEDKGIWFDKANNDRVSGWTRLRTLIEEDRLRVWEGRAPHLLSTLPRLVKDKLIEDDIKKRQKDHWADSLRYGVMGYYDTDPGASKPKEEEDTWNKDTQFDQVAGLAKNRNTDTFDGLGGGW